MNIAVDILHPMYQPHLRRAPRVVQPLCTLTPEVIERHAVRMACGEIGRREFLRWLWADQQCFICGEFGECDHREPEVDLARAHALARAVKRRLS